MAVPDTTTFTLQDVVDEVNPTTDDLVDCFADADAGKFDPAYEGSKNSLLNFRNYGAVPSLPIWKNPHITTGTTGGTTLSIAYPSTVNNNDILILSTQLTPNGTVTTPAGWTQFGAYIMTGKYTMNHFWKRADGTESGNLTLSTGSTTIQSLSASMNRYEGVKTTGTPYEGLHINFAQSVTSLQCNNTNSTTDVNRLAVVLGVASWITAGVTLNGWTYQGGYSGNNGGYVFNMQGFNKDVLTTSNPSGPTINITASSDISYINMYLIPN